MHADRFAISLDSSVEYAVLSDRVFQAKIYLRNRTSTEPLYLVLSTDYIISTTLLIRLDIHPGMMGEIFALHFPTSLRRWIPRESLACGMITLSVLVVRYILRLQL